MVSGDCGGCTNMQQLLIDSRKLQLSKDVIGKRRPSHPNSDNKNHKQNRRDKQEAQASIHYSARTNTAAGESAGTALSRLAG